MLLWILWQNWSKDVWPQCRQQAVCLNLLELFSFAVVVAFGKKSVQPKLAIRYSCGDVYGSQGIGQVRMVGPRVKNLQPGLRFGNLQRDRFGILWQVLALRRLGASPAWCGCWWWSWSGPAVELFVLCRDDESACTRQRLAKRPRANCNDVSGCTASWYWPSAGCLEGWEAPSNDFVLPCFNISSSTWMHRTVAVSAGVQSWSFQLKLGCHFGWRAWMAFGNSCIAFFWMLPQPPSSLRFALQDSPLTIANMATWPKKTRGFTSHSLWGLQSCKLSYVKPFSFTRVSCPVRNVCKRLWPSLLELLAFWSRRLESMSTDVAMQSGHSKTQHILDSWRIHELVLFDLSHICIYLSASSGAYHQACSRRRCHSECC